MLPPSAAPDTGISEASAFSDRESYCAMQKNCRPARSLLPLLPETAVLPAALHPGRPEDTAALLPADAAHEAPTPASAASHLYF